MFALWLPVGCGGSKTSSPSPPPVVSSIAVSCNPSSVAPNGTSQCSATLQSGSSASVAWSANGGAINGSGLFTAPASAAKITISATSSQNASVTATATITVSAPPPVVTSISISCNPSTVAPNATSQCSATSQSGSSATVTWSASGGAITGSGLFTAPASAGKITITATSTQDASVTATATITVSAPPPVVTSIAISCNPSTVAPNATSQCGATSQSGGSATVTWSASGGAITSSGVFTAPASAGNITITATSTQDASITATATITVKVTAPASKHIVLVMEENHSYASVVGNANVWPHLNSLIGQGALAANYYADGHPSIPNYFMLTTGQTLTTHDSSTQVWDVDNIARRMLAASVPFRVYAEGIQRGYVGGNTGLYLIRHNPFAMLSDIANNAQVANEVIWPFSQFASDLSGQALPAFSLIVPDVNDDAHTGTPQQADSWLQANVIVPLSGDPAFQAGGDGVLIVLFDESLDSDVAHGGGHVAAVFWGPNVKSGFTQTSSTVFQHESMLRTVMELLQLQNPPGAAANAPSMTEFFVQK